MADLNKPFTGMPNFGPDAEVRTYKEQLALLGHGYERRNLESIFEKPELYMKEVKSDCIYAWPFVKDPYLKARVRAGYYEYVTKDQIREDTELPYDNGTLAGEPVILVGDLVLVEVQPRAVFQFYKSRALDGLVNAHGDGEGGGLDQGQKMMEAQMADVVGQKNLDNGTVKVKFTKKTEAVKASPESE